MAENDNLTRFIFEKTPIRGELIRLEESYQAIIRQHDYPEPLQKLLGEALSVVALLSAIIKFEGRLSVQFRGKGALRLLLAQCDNEFNLRALAKWDGHLTYEELMQSFNDGVLVIMIDSYNGKANRYQGVVSWQGNSLAESIEGYFKDSEQIKTKIWLAVNETMSAGLLLQAVPLKEQDGLALEEQAIGPHWERISRLTSDIVPDDLLHAEHQALLRTLYPEEEVRVFPSSRVQFKCTCTRKRGEDAIMILGRHEAEEELKDKSAIVVTCDFCNKEYVFDRIEVDEIFQKNDSPPDSQLH